MIIHNETHERCAPISGTLWLFNIDKTNGSFTDDLWRQRERETDDLMIYDDLPFKHLGKL